MTQPTLTAEDMLAWLERTSEGWQKLLRENPHVLPLPCDILNVTSVAGLLQHIVAVELRYAERLASLPATDYAAIPCDSPEAIYATHRRAMELLKQQLASDVDWQERIEFPTRSAGIVRSSRKSILFHALLHSIRHYAQLATLVRQQGIKPGWPMDYLFMDFEPLQAATA